MELCYCVLYLYSSTPVTLVVFVCADSNPERPVCEPFPTALGAPAPRDLPPELLET